MVHTTREAVRRLMNDPAYTHLQYGFKRFSHLRGENTLSVYIYCPRLNRYSRAGLVDRTTGDVLNRVMEIGHYMRRACYELTQDWGIREGLPPCTLEGGNIDSKYNQVQHKMKEFYPNLKHKEMKG